MPNDAKMPSLYHLTGLILALFFLVIAFCRIGVLRELRDMHYDLVLIANTEQYNYGLEI